MITLTKYALRIALQIFALIGLTAIYSAEKVNDVAFQGEGDESDVIMLVIAGLILGLIATVFLMKF